MHGDSPGRNTGVGCHLSSRGSADPGVESLSSAWEGRFFTTSGTWGEPDETYSLAKLFPTDKRQAEDMAGGARTTEFCTVSSMHFALAPRISF